MNKGNCADILWKHSNKRTYKKQVKNPSRVEENYPRDKSKFPIGTLCHR